MRIAITGGTGFIGSHLARRLVSAGHEVVLLARSARNQALPQTNFVATDMSDPAALAVAFQGCDAVAHCAGINREIGSQTYERVHVNATRQVMDAAGTAGVRKVVLMSFLRARPYCGSAYHESKWAAEKIVREAGLNYTIVRAGMVYGGGDHMLNHISHALYTFPVFALVGFEEKPIRPLAIEDLVAVLKAALIDDRMNGKTVAVTGAEQLTLREVLKRVAHVLGRPIRLVKAPVAFHYLLARVCEWTMKIPLVSEAQVRILTEGVVEPALPCDPLPYDLRPTLNFTEEQIRKGLPEPGPFGLSDLRWCSP